MTYAMSPLVIRMQCPPVVACDDHQQPMALQPVFSEEDLASISSHNSKKARQNCKRGILKRIRSEQLEADAAFALQVNDSLNPAPRRRCSVVRYAPPSPPRAPEAPPPPPPPPEAEEPPPPPEASEASLQDTDGMLVTDDMLVTQHAQHFWVEQNNELGALVSAITLQGGENRLVELLRSQQWYTMIQYNGRHACFTNNNYLHSCSVRDEALVGTYLNHGSCSSTNAHGSLKGCLRVGDAFTGAMESWVQDLGTEFGDAAPEAAVHWEQINMLLGRTYCNHEERDYMPGHQDGGHPAQYYSTTCPVVIIASGSAEFSLDISLIANATNSEGPSRTIRFPSRPGSVHVCCFSGRGAQLVRHAVSVPKGPQRFAAVLRGLSQTGGEMLLRPSPAGEQYQQSLHRGTLAVQSLWSDLTSAIRLGPLRQNEEPMLTINDPPMTLGAVDVSAIPEWVKLFMGGVAILGDGGPGSEFLAQQQTLARLGYHRNSIGQAIGVATVNHNKVLASLLLDFTKAESDEDEVRSLGTYADLLQLDLRSNCCVVFMCLPNSAERAKQAKSAALNAQTTQAPVRVLIKHKPMKDKTTPNLLPFISESVLQLPKVVNFPSQLQAHYLGLFMVIDVTEAHVILKRHLDWSSAAKAW